MNVFDFDRTVINDDSTKLFLLYCLRRFPRAFESELGGIGIGLVRYLTGKIGFEGFKESLFGFLKYVPDIDIYVQSFWNDNMSRIEPYYLEIQRADDIIVSASPDFLVRPMAERLGVQLIATPMTKESGIINGVNCKGKEKVRRFKELYPDGYIDAFYSDSLTDAPMARIAERAFLVVNHRPENWPDINPSGI